MVITCTNCFKKFELDSSLIPENGRLLQCNGCDHKWFFKKEIIKEHNTILKIKPSTDEIKLTDNEAETLINEKLENNEPTSKIIDEKKKFDCETKFILSAMHEKGVPIRSS